MMSRPLFSVEKVRWFRYESSGLLPVGHITRDDPRNGQYRNVLDVFHLLSGTHTFSKKFALFYSK